MKRILFKKLKLFIIILTLYSSQIYSHSSVTIITPFRANDPISYFLKVLTDHDYFIESELILISTNFDDEQMQAINQYQYAFFNIRCILGNPTDTISALFNQALQSASGDLITLMRVEDYRDPLLLVSQVKTLEINTAIDVVYSDYHTSYSPNIPTDRADNWYLNELPEFNPHLLYRDIPGPHAMWRKSLHEKYGYFKEDFAFHYLWEFWNRCGKNGVQFKKVAGLPGTYYFNYFNQKKILFNEHDYEKSYQEEKYIRQQYESLWTSIELQEKSFVIVTASYNNKDWYKGYLDSVLNQNYTNYRIIYVDDKSPDQTGKLVQEYAKAMGREDKIEVIINETNVGALENIYNMVHSCKLDEIVLLVDGDDRLPHNDVLKHLNAVYQDPNIWLTYGQFQWFPAQIPGFIFQIPNWVIEQNSIRSYRWITTHLRTFYAGLFQKIKKEDLLYEGKFYVSAWDLGIMYPMVEMAGYHTRFISEIVYIYNTANSINDNKVNIDLQGRIDTFIRHKDRYTPIASWKD